MRSLKHLVKYAAIVALIGILASCAPVTIVPQTHSNISTLGKITYIKVLDVKSSTKSGQLQATITLLNSHRKSETLYYRFKWLDQDGVPIDNSSWKTLIFYGEQSQVLKGVATVTGASDFILELASDKARSIKN